jgi:hypothetical protein
MIVEIYIGRNFFVFEFVDHLLWNDQRVFVFGVLAQNKLCYICDMQNISSVSKRFNPLESNLNRASMWVFFSLWSVISSSVSSDQILANLDPIAAESNNLFECFQICFFLWINISASNFRRLHASTRSPEHELGFCPFEPNHNDTSSTKNLFLSTSF